MTEVERMDTLGERTAEDPQPNERRLTDLVHWVEEQSKLEFGNSEREWAQWLWGETTECGTLYCCAGKAAVDAGWYPTKAGRKPDGTVLDCFLIMSPRPGEDMESKPDHMEITEIGMQVLGITEQEADMLFSGVNDAETIRQLTESILGHTLPVKAGV